MFLIFFLIALSITAGVHYYLYRRLVVGPELPPPWFGIGRAALIALGISIPLSFFANRLLGLHATRVLVFPIYVWMGLMALFFFSFLGLDVLRAVLVLGSRVSGHGEWIGSPERRLFLSRVVAWTAAGIVLPTAGVGVAWGLGKLVVKRIEVTLRNLPRELDGFTIAQLTDLHMGPMRGGRWLSEVVKRTNALGPDLVAITGDLVDGTVAELATDVEPLRELQAREGVVFVTGNHEYFNDLLGWMEHLPKLGLRVLRNEHITLRRGKVAVDIAGVDDPTGRRFAPGHGTDLGQALSGRDTGRPVVLLAHQPKIIDEAQAQGVDLVLSGHTHGGQLWPFSYLVALSQPYLKGLHDHGGTQIYVSSGTGFWGPPMRLGTTAEISLITLRAG
jgi:hypothetical protein